MKYRVRPMQMEDVPQVSEIEREVFPTQWPFTVYKRELQNKLAHYLVGVEDGEPLPQIRPSGSQETKSAAEPASSGWLGRLKRLFTSERTTPAGGAPRPVEHVVGAVGFWLMLDEAHITTIGVRARYQRQGIGELLLIKSIELAQELGARVATLEVRVSNTGAQALYEKYGFKRVGLRRRYYSDNNEDALIMTTDNISSASYKTMFQEIRETHAQKWV